MNANDFIRESVTNAVARSEGDSADSKTIIARCPAGEVALGGGAEISRPTFGTPAEFPVALQSNTRNDHASWRASAIEMGAYESGWRLTVTAKCVPARDGEMHLE
ncbi:MAG: hypothetical protein M3494_06355 [Actinomycetota bacterium]|nr:hypothetical protein [Rubrobacter sp.]MDQ3507620.1 hypothetical protein [Actinomycetota bacterium]